MKNFTVKSLENKYLCSVDTEEEAKAVCKGYFIGTGQVAKYESSFGDLRDYHASPSAEEPEAPSTPWGRNQIRRVVRACLLRKRSIEVVMSQVGREFGYSDKTTALATHFFNYEKAS